MIATTSTATRVVRVIDVDELPDDAAFWRHCLLDAERAACDAHERPLLHRAARLAAKQAWLDLLDVSPDEAACVCHDIEVRAAPRSQPELVLHGGMARRAGAAGIAGVAVSLTHTAKRTGACVAVHPAGCRVGLDLLDVQRWELALRRTGTALVARVTSAAERDDDRRRGRDSTRESGARFSVKECVVKALDGFPAGSGFRDIDVIAGDGGVRVHLHGALAKHMEQNGLVVVEAELRELPADHLQSIVVIAPREGC